MQLEATGKPIRYRLKSGEEVILRPGVPTELPDHAANQLLKKAPNKVRRVNRSSMIEPGTAITWEGADFSVRHGVVDFVDLDTDGTAWVFVTMPDGCWAAVNLRYAKVIV
jgi:hypothetical protein